MSNWKPSASIETLKSRAALFASIRAFFAERQVFEVDTPNLSHFAVSDPYLHPVQSTAMGQNQYLHTSPEYPMKRLLCAGSGDIYFLGKVFRDGEVGKRHNPEFTMLEWYRVGWDHHKLMIEVADLLKSVLNFSAVKHHRYKDLFIECLAINPHQASSQELKQLAQPFVGPEMELDKDGWLDILMTHVIEPEFSQDELNFVTDYPASQAALAKIVKDSEGELVAERFEAYGYGLELANGYHELTDWQQQETRFQREQEIRKSNGGSSLPTDHLLVDALKSGMPECAGVALGFDRLLMLKLDIKDIAQVIPFGFDRA